jgi:hypothetical protein
VTLVQSSIRGLLRPGERVLWEGRPDIRAYSLRGAWFLIPFSILWGGFAIFWEYSAITRGAGPFFILWGIPFVAIGLYMAFGRIYVARREAANTSYAITDQRVLVETGAFRRRLTQLDLRDLPMAQLEDGGGGRGSITFGASGYFRVPPGWPTLGMYGQPAAFMAIPDAARVFRTLQDAKDEARAGAGAR